MIIIIIIMTISWIVGYNHTNQNNEKYNGVVW